MSHSANPPTPLCPDCGAPNEPGAVLCSECNHPLAPIAPPAAAVALARPRRFGRTAEEREDRPGRPDRPERPERVDPNVATWGYRPARGGDTTIPSWLWLAVGLLALGAVFASAIQIARQPAPLAIPNATKPQLSSAESLRVVLRRDTTAVAPNVALGNLFYDTSNFGEAIPYYRRALRRDPSLTDVRVDLGVAYHNAGLPDSAIAVLEQVIANEPDHAIAHFDLAVLYQAMGRRTEARRMFEKAKALDGPAEMDAMIDEMLARLAAPPGGATTLPPGHPPMPEGSPRGR